MTKEQLDKANALYTELETQKAIQTALSERPFMLLAKIKDRCDEPCSIQQFMSLNALYTIKDSIVRAVKEQTVKYQAEFDSLFSVVAETGGGDQ